MRFFPGCECCGPAPPTGCADTGCAVMPYQWSLTMAGLSDGLPSSGCASLNGTFTLTYYEPAGGGADCEWRSPEGIPFYVLRSTGSLTVIAGFATYGIAAAWDCLGSNDFNLVTSSADCVG